MDFAWTNGVRTNSILISAGPLPRYFDLVRVRHWFVGSGGKRRKGRWRKGWDVRKHRRASLEQVIANTAYARGDYRLDLARGSIKA